MNVTEPSLQEKEESFILSDGGSTTIKPRTLLSDPRKRNSPWPHVARFCALGASLLPCSMLTAEHRLLRHFSQHTGMAAPTRPRARAFIPTSSKSFSPSQPGLSSLSSHRRLAPQTLLKSLPSNCITYSGFRRSLHPRHLKKSRKCSTP